MDQSVLDFFVSHRIEWATFCLLTITYFGNSLVIIAFSLASVAYFYIQKRFALVFPILLSVSGSAATVLILKVAVGRARPPLADMVYIDTGPSFPSWHAAGAMAFYGFLIYALWRTENSRAKNIVLSVLLLALIILIGASRLYLGVHYLSDVVAGFAVGLIWILISRSVSRSKIWHLLAGERL